MNFTIKIEKLQLPVKLGWLANERTKPQAVHFDIELDLVAPKVASSDQLEDTVDYMKVVACVSEMTSSNSWRMNEKMCCDIAASLLELSPMIEQVRVAATKNVIPNAAGVTAKFTLSR